MTTSNGLSISINKNAYSFLSSKTIVKVAEMFLSGKKVPGFYCYIDNQNNCIDIMTANTHKFSHYFLKCFNHKTGIQSRYYFQR